MPVRLLIILLLASYTVNREEGKSLADLTKFGLAVQVYPAMSRNRFTQLTLNATAIHFHFFHFSLEGPWLEPLPPPLVKMAAITSVAWVRPF